MVKQFCISVRGQAFLSPVRFTHSRCDLSSQRSALSNQPSAVSLRHKIHSLRLITLHSLPITVFLLFPAPLRPCGRMLLISLITRKSCPSLITVFRQSEECTKMVMRFPSFLVTGGAIGNRT